MKITRKGFLAALAGVPAGAAGGNGVAIRTVPAGCTWEARGAHFVVNERHVRDIVSRNYGGGGAVWPIKTRLIDPPAELTVTFNRTEWSAPKH